MLQIKNVSVAYGKVQALWNVSLDVQEGEIVSLVGSNAAGKSTLLQTIMGINKPMAGGEIIYKDESLVNLKTSQIVKKGIVLCPEGRLIFPKMSIYENLLCGAYTTDKSNIESGIERAFNLFPILRERQKQAGGTLSGGEQQMLAIARSLMSNPNLLLLDEPSLGLSPLFTDMVFDLITRINQQGVTILIVEQNASMALSIANSAYVLQNGEIHLSGTGKELLENEEVIRLYLGVS